MGGPLQWLRCKLSSAVVIAITSLIACSDADGGREVGPADDLDVTAGDAEVATELPPDTDAPDLEPEAVDDAVPDTTAPDAPETAEDVVGDTLPDTGPARCGDGVQQAGEACDDADLDDLDGCDRRCATTRVVRAPHAGEVALNELMVNPAATLDPRGEWIELVSLAAEELDLSACALVDDGTDVIPLAVEGGLALAPGALFLVASEGGPAVLDSDLDYTTMLLDDSGDEVSLVCDGVEVDRVAWTPFAWPIIGGRALALDPTRRDAEANDDVVAWCAATSAYGSGERGTPGAPNLACPHLDRSVDRCRLLGDAVVSGFADAPVPFDVEIEELGLTDLTPAVDASPELVIEVGHAGASADPADPAAFLWTHARPEAGYQAPAGSRADVWQGEVVAADVGTRRVMARASRDGGSSWRYCDRNGSEDGVSAAELARVDVAPSPCAAVSCLAPPAASCAADGVHLLGFESEGTCVPSGATTWDCEYAPSDSDCGLLGRVCEEGAGGAVCGSVPRTPVAGDVILAELMLRPSVPTGQWVELRSLADEPLLLTGCVLAATDTADTTTEWVLESPTVIGPAGPAGLIVLGRSQVFDESGGAPVDRAWGAAFGDAGLPSSQGTLALSCGEPLDEVGWDGSWPGISGAVGASVSLSPLFEDAAENDDADAWCRAEASYGAGDRGTPGSLNPTCPGDLVPVDRCSLGGPASLTPPAGTQASAPVHIVATTWTAKTQRTDPSPKLVVEVGLVARGAAPSAVTSWLPSVPDTGWFAGGSGVDPAEDRYTATFRAPAPGDWDLYARATADGGNSWSFCDRNGILASGTGAPVLIDPLPSPCHPDPCGAVPEPYCAANGEATEVIASEGPALCSLDAPNHAKCTFVESLAEDCADAGGVCAEGPDGAYCTGFPRVPRAGEVVLTELLIAPGGLELGEWVELQNVGADALDLSSCGLRSARQGTGGLPEQWSFGAPLSPLGFVIAPGAVMTVARSGSSSVNGNSQPVTVWEEISLDNAADTLQIVCTQSNSTTVIDAVSWTSASGWTIPSLASLQLSGAKLDAVSNDKASSWCAAGKPSPRATNPVCPADGVLDDCELKAPRNAEADEAFAVSLLVQDLGVTNLRPVVDAALGMLVEVGVGPGSESPTSSFAWHWVELEPDADWDDRQSGPAGWDNWVSTTSAGAVGSLRVLARVSLDGGASWTFCGPSGIVQGAAEGQALASSSGVCIPSPCTTPPANFCSGATLTGYPDRGECFTGPSATCSYQAEAFSCANYGGCNAPSAGCNAGPARPSTAGSVIISEVMRDSSLPAPDFGEWVELYNASAAPVDLRDCELVDAAGARSAILRGVPEVVLSGAHMVLAHTAVGDANGGIPTTFSIPRSLGALSLGNGADSLTLMCGGVLIDRVTWGWDWPGQTGVAMQLDRAHLNGSDNDVRGNWCAAAPVYGTAGNRGSPGSLNPACP